MYILLSDTIGLIHIHHTIVYTENGIALKNKQKYNDAIHLIMGVPELKDLLIIE